MSGLKDKLYTLRWYLSNKWGESSAQKDAIEIVTDLIGDGKDIVIDPIEEEPDRPNRNEPGKNLKWIPFARLTNAKMPTRGYYKNNYPEGMIVHWHSGHSSKDPDATENNTITYGARHGYNYLVIDRFGTTFQSTALNKWGYHAGKSSWKGLGTSVSKYLVGVELEAAGTLKGGKSWFGASYPASETRSGVRKDNCASGTYHKYTKEQEKELIELIMWLKFNNPSVFNLDLVLGHDEVSIPPGRKTDPGWALSSTMPEFRSFLKKEYEHRVKSILVKG